MTVRRAVGWAVLATAAAGAWLVASARDDLKVAKLASFSTREAPLFTPFFKKDRPPEPGDDYDDCVGPQCDKIPYTVTFGRGPGGKCPDSVHSGYQNCKKADDDPESCTAIKRGRAIVFQAGAYPYQVRFSPFGESIKVGTSAGSSEQRIHKRAATAWYKFTVYGDDVICQGVNAVDPNVIVTN